MLPASSLRVALAEVPLASFVGYASRVIEAKHQNQPLSCEGSKSSNGRYHVRGINPVLYLSDTPETALHEIRAIIEVGVGIRTLPIIPHHIFSVVCRLNAVLDVVDLATQQLLGTSHQELTGAWMTYDAQHPAPTQTLANVAYQIGVQALKVPSATHCDAWNLVIFCDRMEGAISVYTG